MVILILLVFLHLIDDICRPFDPRCLLYVRNQDLSLLQAKKGLDTRLNLTYNFLLYFIYTCTKVCCNSAAGYEHLDLARRTSI
jgi:hypothetical protein